MQWWTNLIGGRCNEWNFDFTAVWKMRVCFMSRSKGSLTLWRKKNGRNVASKKTGLFYFQWPSRSRWFITFQDSSSFFPWIIYRCDFHIERLYLPKLRLPRMFCSLFEKILCSISSNANNVRKRRWRLYDKRFIKSYLLYQTVIVLCDEVGTEENPPAKHLNDNRSCVMKYILFWYTRSFLFLLKKSCPFFVKLRSWSIKFCFDEHMACSCWQSWTSRTSFVDSV